MASWVISESTAATAPGIAPAPLPDELDWDEAGKLTLVSAEERQCIRENASRSDRGSSDMQEAFDAWSKGFERVETTLHRRPRSTLLPPGRVRQMTTLPTVGQTGCIQDRHSIDHHDRGATIALLSPGGMHAIDRVLELFDRVHDHLQVKESNHPNYIKIPYLSTIMLVSLKKVLEKARRENYAVGSFNINNLEFLQAIMEAAEAEKSPVIISTSEGAIEYAGMAELGLLTHLAAERSKHPVVFHLDHGKNYDLVVEAIKSGLYTSVMYDGSSLPYKENVRTTKKIVTMAHKQGISVEAELGAIAGIEDFVSVEEKNAHLTDPEQAEDFVRQTGCDALAIAIGTSHGAYKFTEDSALDFKRLEAIKQHVKIPLVLHGASGIPENIKKICTKYGCRISKAKGVSDAHIKRAVKLGVNKVNIDSDLRIAFDAGVRRFLHDNPEVIDPRKILGPAKELMTRVVRHKMRLFGSAKKG